MGEVDDESERAIFMLGHDGGGAPLRASLVSPPILLSWVYSYLPFQLSAQIT
jgi:hypothetical protein